MQIILKFKLFYEAFYEATDTEHVGMYRILHLWIEAMLNSSSCIREIALLTDNNILACPYYDGVILTKKNNYIVVKQISDHNTDRENIHIPKYKFVQILDVIKNDVHPIIKKHTPKELLFTFDDEWNCTITWKLP